MTLLASFNPGLCSSSPPSLCLSFIYRNSLRSSCRLHRNLIPEPTDKPSYWGCWRLDSRESTLSVTPSIQTHSHPCPINNRIVLVVFSPLWTGQITKVLHRALSMTDISTTLFLFQYRHSRSPYPASWSNPHCTLSRSKSPHGPS